MGIITKECSNCGSKANHKDDCNTNLSCQSCGAIRIKFLVSEPVTIQCIKCGNIVCKDGGVYLEAACGRCKSLLWKINPVDVSEISSAETKSDEIEKVIEKEENKYPVSAVVVCHNNVEITQVCIEKLKKANPGEIILVDNASTDRTEEWARNRDWIKYIKNQMNLGCGIARNQGAKWASKEYVFFLDNDQYVQKNIFEKMFLIKEDLVGVDHWKVINGGSCVPSSDNKISWNSYVGAGGLLIRKKDFVKLGGFDERFAPCWYEDVDFSFRARKQGFSVGCLKESGIQHLMNTTINSQKDYDPKVIKEKSKDLFLTVWGEFVGRIPKMLNEKSKGQRLIRRQKSKILMLIDVPGWAWEFKTNQIIKHLQNEFEFTVHHPGLGRIDPSAKYDLYFTYECNQVGKLWEWGIPSEEIVTGVTSHTFVNYPNYKKHLEGSKALHANSKLLLEELADFKLPKYYLPNGVDEKLFPYVKRDINDIFRAGFVGKPHRKGIKEIIEPACKKAGVELKALVGGVQEAGRIPHSEMPKFYQDIDVVLIASTKDGTPNMLLEAAATGRTFIGNKIGNVPEFFEEDENGFMLPARDIKLYVEKIEWMRDNRLKCAKMGIEARRTVEMDWTWKIQSEAYRKMFREVLTSV